MGLWGGQERIFVDKEAEFTYIALLIYLYMKQPLMHGAPSGQEMARERDPSFLSEEQIEEIRIDSDPQARIAMMEITQRRTVPQIFIGDTHVGGCDDLMALDGRGGLIPLLQGA